MAMSEKEEREICSTYIRIYLKVVEEKIWHSDGNILTDLTEKKAQKESPMCIKMYIQLTWHWRWLRK